MPPDRMPFKSQVLGDLLWSDEGELEVGQFHEINCPSEQQRRVARRYPVD